MLYQKLRRTFGAPGNYGIPRIMGNRCWFRLFFPDILTLQNDMDFLVDGIFVSNVGAVFI